LKIAFESGANQITGGSIAENRELFENGLRSMVRIKLFWEQMRIMKSSCFRLEDSNEDLIPFIQDYQNKGIQYVICTDIAKDGMLEGPSFDLYAKILQKPKE
jgi:phosphoribosylformimino-5-aminoimidazole carboxamide ribotide isomerase